MCVCSRVKCSIEIGPPNYNPPILGKTAKYNFLLIFHTLRYNNTLVWLNLRIGRYYTFKVYLHRMLNLSESSQTTNHAVVSPHIVFSDASSLLSAIHFIVTLSAQEKEIENRERRHTQTHKHTIPPHKLRTSNVERITTLPIAL